MKTAIAATVMTLTVMFSTSVLAADDHSGHGAMHGAVPASAAMTGGVIKKVDMQTSKVTVAHGPLVNLGMPAMTMVFRVKDTSWLEQMKDGDKIRFIADNVNGSLTVVKFDKAN